MEVTTTSGNQREDFTGLVLAHRMPGRAPIYSKLPRLMVMSALGFITVIGLVLLQRRAVGALTQPLLPEALMVLGLVLVSVAWGWRRMLPAATSGRNLELALGLAPTVVLAIWLAAVCLPGTSLFGLGLLFAIVVTEEAPPVWRLYERFFSPSATLAPGTQDNSHPDVLPMTSASPVISWATQEHVQDESFLDQSRETEAVAAETIADESITQQMTRRRDDNASESIEGWVRVDFAAGQRHAAAHLAICPPLDRLPECFAEPADGPAATVKVGQVLTHGVRLDVKLDEPTPEPACVLVEFSLQSPAQP